MVKKGSAEEISLSPDKNEEIINMMDENENFIISESKNDLLVEECSTKGNSVPDLIPKLKALQLTPKSKNSDSEQLAGYIRAVILECGLVVIGLAPGGQILDIGTVIFILTADGAPRQIGAISDIFGSVYEPMYSVMYETRVVGDLLKMDAEVFYLRDHPSTNYIGVKREADNRYTIVRNSDTS